MKKGKIKKYYLYSPTNPIKRLIFFTFWTTLYLVPATCVFLFTYYIMFHKWWCIFFSLPFAIFIIILVRRHFFDYFYLSQDTESIIVKRLKYKTVEYKISAINKLGVLTDEEYKDLGGGVLYSIGIDPYSFFVKACGHNDDCLFVFEYNKETAGFFKQHNIPFPKYDR